MKYDWKKEDKEFYLPKGAPTLVRMPALSYFSVSGRGSPSGTDFQHAVEMLYSASYTLKMFPKKHPVPADWYDYSVFPLEAAWAMPDGAENRDAYEYDVMIRQPDFLTPSLRDTIMELCRTKKNDLPWERLATMRHAEGECLQILHIGPYAEEKASFDLLDAYCHEHALERRGLWHKEIYLSDPNRTQPDKLKTVLRYWVGPKGQKLSPVTWGGHG